MPIWDSVQRGLEKASQEAQRIAKTQRLRSTIDTLSRQMNIQSSNLVNKTMELFHNGQLTQNELLSICQELAYLKQQVDAAQNELRQVQAAQLAGPMPPMPTPIEGTYELPPTVYAPPPPGYQAYPESGANVTPPPPPGVEPLTISAKDTVLMDAPPPPPAPSAPQSEKRLCPACQAELQSEYAFCHNCGTLVETSSSPHEPTARAGMPASAYGSGEATVLPEHSAPYMGGEATVRAEEPSENIASPPMADSLS